MKALISLVCLSLSLNILKAQNVENPSFDSAYIGAIDRIHHWITSEAWAMSANDTVFPLFPDTHYIASGLQYHELLNSVQLEYSGAFHGTLAIKMLGDTSTVDIYGDPFPGFIVNGDHFYTDSVGYIDLAKCGTPFPYRPDKLRGHYQYEDNSPSLNNYPTARLLLKKYNTSSQQSDTIGYGSLSAQLFPVVNWTLFEMPITYVSNLVPDSIVLFFKGAGIASNSIFKLDSLGFEYPPVSVEENSNSEIRYYIIGNQLHVDENNLFSSLTIFDLQGRQVIRSLKNTTDLTST